MPKQRRPQQGADEAQRSESQSAVDRSLRAQGESKVKIKPTLRIADFLTHRAPQLFLGFALLCLLYAAVASMANGFRLARQPYQFDYEEGNVLNAAARMNAGLTPYPAPGTWPVVLNSYGPIPYAISAALIRSGDINFFRPRMVSLLAALVVACDIVLLAAYFTNDLLVAISVGVFFLTLPLVQQWSPLLRVDFLALAFSLTGLVVFFRLPRLRLAASVLFALALLCKITFIAAPLTCAIVLIREKRWRELTVASLAGAAVLGTTVWALQWSTHGWFLFHQFGTHVDPLSWANYRDHALQVLRQTSVLVALCLIGIVRHRRLSPPWIYLIVVLLATATALKQGSESNHFLELEAALCIAAAVVLHEMQTFRWVVVVCAAILAVQGIVTRALYTSKGVVDECPQAYAYIRDHHRILSENVGALVLTGKPVLLSNPFVYAQLVRHGKWPNQRVEQTLQLSEADLVIIGKPAISEQRWSAPALAALAANYHVTHRFACVDTTLAYEPNSASRASEP